MEVVKDPYTPEDRLRLALDSLEGLSVGDGLGERFFWPEWDGGIKAAIGVLPPHPWWWTDDSNMAMSVVEVLAEHGSIDQDRLAQSFLDRYEPWRGYGRAMGEYFEALSASTGWREAAGALFNGTGSAGNGAAMRVAPLGAYWAGDLDRAAVEGRQSAEVTHAHEEGIAGAIAVAVAASLAAARRDEPAPTRPEFLGAVADLVPDSKVRDGLVVATTFLGTPQSRGQARERQRLRGAGHCAVRVVVRCGQPRRLRGGTVGNGGRMGRRRHDLRDLRRCRRCACDGQRNPGRVAPASRATARVDTSGCVKALVGTYGNGK